MKFSINDRVRYSSDVFEHEFIVVDIFHWLGETMVNARSIDSGEFIKDKEQNFVMIQNDDRNEHG